MAGTNPCTEASALAKEDFGSDSTDYVQVPWDILQEYYFKASKAALRIPSQSRLSWLERADLAERAAWVAEFRAGGTAAVGKTLGKVVKDLLDRRAPHWEAPVIVSGGQPGGGRPPAGPTTAPNLQLGPFSKQEKNRRRNERRESKGKGGGKGGKGTPRGPTVSSTLSQGDRACPDFQKANCNSKVDNQGKGCPKGIHRCAKILKNGRVCSTLGHCAKNCPRA